MNDEIQQIDWAMLLPHAKRDALFLVDLRHDLARVAAAVRDDETAFVATLLESGQMWRPGPDELETEPAGPFMFVIVQPYVLAQGPVPVH